MKTKLIVRRSGQDDAELELVSTTSEDREGIGTIVAALVDSGATVILHRAGEEEARPNNLGMRVVVFFTGGGSHPQILRNVTEIHYNYGDFGGPRRSRITFESDVHGTGITHDIEDILELEAKVEAERADDF